MNTLLCPYRGDNILHCVWISTGRKFRAYRFYGSVDHFCRYIICWCLAWTVLSRIRVDQQRSQFPYRYAFYKYQCGQFLKMHC